MVSRDVQAIQSLFDDVSCAVAVGKVEEIEDFVAPNARGFVPGTPVLQGRAAILNELRGRLCTWRHDLRISCSEIVAKDQWGFCSGTFGLRSVHIASGTTRYNDAKFLCIVHKGEDGRWRIYRICYSSNLPDSERCTEE